MAEAFKYQPTEEEYKKQQEDYESQIKTIGSGNEAAVGLYKRAERSYWGLVEANLMLDLLNFGQGIRVSRVPELVKSSIGWLQQKDPTQKDYWKGLGYKQFVKFNQREGARLELYKKREWPSIYASERKSYGLWDALEKSVKKSGIFSLEKPVATPLPAPETLQSFEEARKTGEARVIPVEPLLGKLGEVVTQKLSELKESPEVRYTKLMQLEDIAKRKLSSLLKIQKTKTGAEAATVADYAQSLKEKGVKL